MGQRKTCWCFKGRCRMNQLEAQINVSDPIYIVDDIFEGEIEHEDGDE